MPHPVCLVSGVPVAGQSLHYFLPGPEIFSFIHPVFTREMKTKRLRANPVLELILPNKYNIEIYVQIGRDIFMCSGEHSARLIILQGWVCVPVIQE
ncbi:hypothetical protein MKMG_01388 [Methanogenium sp. MK-MG]|nr:hypothetical protein MKMG_01388 [Methanogenium sp. MK-MG]